MARVTGTGTNRTKKETPVKKHVIPQPTREDIKNAILWTARNTNRVPVAVGPTASGKTFMFWQIAEEINADLHTILLAQHTPDEVAGFQYESKDKGLIAGMPYWFTAAQASLDSGKNVIIFFDELNLSREETRGVLYTFMRDRHIRGVSLQTRKPGQEILVVAAANPGVFAPPFRSRSVFFGVPADRSYLSKMAKTSLAKQIAQVAPISHDSDPSYDNLPPPEPIVIDASAIEALNATTRGGFGMLTEAAQFLVYRGLVPPSTLQEVLTDKADPSALLLDRELLMQTLRELDVDEAVNTALSALEAGLSAFEPKVRAEIVVDVLAAMYDNPWKLYHYFEATKSDELVQTVLNIDHEHCWEYLKQKGYHDYVKKGEYYEAKGVFRNLMEKYTSDPQYSDPLSYKTE